MALKVTGPVACSPSRMLATTKNSPPTSISLANPIPPAAILSFFCDKIDPTSQHKIAANSPSDASNCAPANPHKMPNHSWRLGQSPNKPDKPDKIIGEQAINTAVSPDDTYCSAHAVKPVPPPSIRMPMMPPSRHSRQVGIVAPRHSCHKNRIDPAATKRVPIIINGGNDSSAT